MNLKRPLRGSETGADVRMVQRALNRWSGQAVPIPTDGKYGQRTSDRMVAFQLAEKISPARGDFGQETLDKLWPSFDRYGKWRYRLYRLPRPKPKVPDLGPVYAGGASVLLHSLTHETDGIPGYPAFDDGWRAGRAVLAPEDLEITEQSGSAGGDAFYARGKSSINYWFGHLAWAPPTGRAFGKGQSMGVIANIPQSQGGPHVHVGLDARALIGHEFEHKTNYQTGAPSVGEQLTRALTTDG